MKLTESICYYCENPATSKEHVPPKVIFPKDKRKQLIKVPSCDLHNMEKSNDDTYFWYLLTGVISSEKMCYEKIIRATQRKPMLAQSILRDVGLDRSYIVDHKRFDNSLESIVRGLHFYDNGCRCGKLSILCTNLGVALEPEIEEKRKMVVSAFKEIDELDGFSNYKGENPSIFKYRTTKYKNNTLYFICFYDELNVYAVVESVV